MTRPLPTLDLQAGKLSPICLALVAFLLYLFRSIYGEIGSALPVNGGSYNALLNTTTKTVAALAACLSILSYVSTAVVSAGDAIVYLATVVDVNLIWPTVVLLGFFMALTIWGVGESAVVALTMYTVHILTLAAVMIASIVFVIRDGGARLRANLDTPVPDVYAGDAILANGSWAACVFFGFASGLLGVSGFESASNFIEEQKPGVFPKVLRNMWATVTILNVGLSICGLFVLTDTQLTELSSYSEIVNPNKVNSVLVIVAQEAGGKVLGTIMSIDAFIVLCGSTLTAFVGVSGLLRRLSLDRCLPAVLLQVNKLRKTNHWIQISFGVISASLFLALEGNVDALGGVYAISFLSVMALFAIGCILLKYKRPSLPRASKAKPVVIGVALIMTLLGIAGNVIQKPVSLRYWIFYFAGTVAIVFGMFQRARILQLALPLIRGAARAVPCLARFEPRIVGSIRASLKAISETPLVYFAKRPDLPVLNKVILYVRENEQSDRLTIVHVREPRRRAGSQPSTSSGSGSETGSHRAAALRQSMLEGRASTTLSINAPHATSPGTPETTLRHRGTWIQDALRRPVLAGASGTHHPTTPHSVASLHSPTHATAAESASMADLPDDILELAYEVQLLDAVYPKLRIDFLVVEGTTFGPEVIEWLADYLHVTTNLMFISCPDQEFRQQLSALKGVRVVTRPSRSVHEVHGDPGDEESDTEAGLEDRLVVPDDEVPRRPPVESTFRSEPEALQSSQPGRSTPPPATTPSVAAAPPSPGIETEGGSAQATSVPIARESTSVELTGNPSIGDRM